jgi:proliferating cell nuclear antigen
MEIQINDKKKKDIFVSIFQVLKNCSSLANIVFEPDFLHIQGMDKSHVCLYDVKIRNNWFTKYHVTEVIKICLDTTVFFSIISTKSDNQQLNIFFNNDTPDILNIHFVPNGVKGEFKKRFKMTLVEYDYEELIVSNIDYDAELSLSSKQLNEIFSQLNNFGDDITFECSENNVSLTTNGVTGEMKVDIQIEDLNSFAIVEDEEVSINYSLSYINKMCVTNKLSTDIELSLSKTAPMKISYDLGEDSLMVFYIAPKII